MTRVVFDSSALLAFVREEPGAERVRPLMGHGAISSVNLQELVKALLSRGADVETARQIVSNMHLDVRPHETEDAFAAAELFEATKRFGRGLGDRSCMALAIKLGVPALTTDREWIKVEVPGLRVELIR